VTFEVLSNIHSALREKIFSTDSNALSLILCKKITLCDKKFSFYRLNFTEKFQIKLNNNIYVTMLSLIIINVFVESLAHLHDTSVECIFCE
jgi:hypothetical protein